MTSIVRLALLSAALAPAATVRFAVIGDRTGSRVPGVYEGIVAEVERLKPDFVLTVGDQIEGYTRDTSRLSAEWLEYDSITAGLSMPLYVTPGNHDITYDLAEPLFESRYGTPSRSFDAGGHHFIILDNSRCEAAEKLGPAQLAWLEADLRRARNRRVFVFFHKPFWFQQAFEGKPDTLHALFRRYGVDAVFSGHYHQYLSGTLDGIKYTCVGSSGGGTDEGPTGVTYHYTWVTVTTDSVYITPVKNGAALGWDDVTAAEQQTINSVAKTAYKFSGPVLIREGPARGAFSLTVANSLPDAPLQESLWWKHPGNWRVEPAIARLDIPAGACTTLLCSAWCRGAVYPVPAVHCRFPYAVGKTSDIYDWMPVARTAVCTRAAAAPVIDGDLSDPCWQQPVTRLFDADEGAAPRTESTSFWFAFDDRNLYLAAWCRESRPESTVALATERDGAVYSDDCVGWFLSPTGSDPVYQLYFNPAGIAFDQKIVEYSGDQSWNGDYEVHSRRGDDFWCLEVRVPLATVGATPVGPWKTNFRRKQQRLGAVADWQVPITYNPATFGFLEMK